MDGPATYSASSCLSAQLAPLFEEPSSVSKPRMIDVSDDDDNDDEDDKEDDDELGDRNLH